MTVLVIGATGRTAAHLVHRLIGDGISVRGLVRDATKAHGLFGTRREMDLVAGRFDDPALLQSAMTGVDAAFLALSTSHEQVALEKGVIDAAAVTGLPYLARLSVFDADLDAGYEIGRRHADVDDHLAASGVAHTVLRPTYFSSNLLLQARSIAADGFWAGAAPHARVAVVDTRDVAEVAAAVLRDPQHRAPNLDITGPESLGFAEIADRLGAILGRTVSYRPVDGATLRVAATARGVPGWLADIAVGIDTAMEAGRHEQVTDTVQRITGRAARRIDDFLTGNRAAFLPRVSR